MELWGGHECTVNRVRDRYRDQTRLTGHQDRIEDLAAFAALGIKKLRYPVLWERVAPERPDDRDWSWSDRRLGEIDRLGMQPIIGLIHHGSGPRYTSLISDNFVDLFAAHAAATAQRYPQVADWTPVNEPLTTARFSTLYGFWYPHARDETLFWTALLNQVDATRAAMTAIRRVNPAARLVQTEDLGQYHSTKELASTAEHFNLRRWATWDLLTGRVVRDHALWPHLDALGLGDRLRAIADDPCPPDVIGVNYYPTSERFLDHRLDAYPYPPPEEGYHELTAARVMDPPAPGLSGLLRQAWHRYRLPLAVTESHLGCSREEQLRWLWQSWRACRGLAAEGVDIRAFTAWALLGNIDWNSLITIDAGHYEPGAFDVRGPEIRPTAIADLLAALGSGVDPTPAAFPAIEGLGWWQRSIRLEHAPFTWGEPAAAPVPECVPRPILITGATGTLGQALAGECELRGLPYVLSDRATLPIADPERVAAFLDEHQPWAVINAAGWVNVDQAEEEAENCFRTNSDGAAVLAQACAMRGIRCTIFSSDLVFDGRRQQPYLEGDRPRPLGIYGESKMRAEALTVGTYPDTLAIRTAAFFSPHDPHNFARGVERSLREGRIFCASADAIVSPTFVPDLVRACLDLVVDGERGIWHLANGGAVSWLEFGRMIAEALDLDPAQVRPASPCQLGWRAKRPRYSALGSERGTILSSLSDAVSRHAAARRGGC
ncbi:MAG: dTDP-4-dehydrorhamnose reductase [Sphingomonas bacterium]|nr:dTDP-4-dehydrorhamnose reductase [Sphingomonas bacterium]